uniref:N-domain of Clp chaperone n=1 Tax=Chlorobotrys sp. TaxID=2859677 RepID=UPI00218237D1|nr:N-domain of Clp chaperone [Chlorobotrys sp.]UVI60816.1 N-domain of Clp chaperone [Chlorobotrys sp.]
MYKRKININILNKNLFSLQLKKAIFYSFLEARKYENTIIDSQFLLYGILKTNHSIIYTVIQQISKTRSLSFNLRRELLIKLKLNFQTKNKLNFSSTDQTYPNFSRTIKRLLVFLINSPQQNSKISVITTLQVFKYLLHNKSVSKLIKDCLVTGST